MTTPSNERPPGIKRRRRRGPVGLGAAGVAVVLAGTAFVMLTRTGGDDDAGTAADNDPLVVAVVSAMHERSGGTITDAEASCMAEGLISSVGADRMSELGVLDGADPVLALDTPEREVAITKAFDCLDDAAMIEFVAWSPERLGDLSPDTMSCVYRSWLDQLGRERMIHVYSAYVQPIPPPFDEVLNVSEAQLAADAGNVCIASASTSTSSG